jgi:peptidoglycan/xylan/chitin deacetylase (PgdA/CDA1 family)
VEIDRGATDQPLIALTFDAGGPAEPANQILAILAKHHVHVTWFITGQWANANPDLLRRIHNEGHELGNHTMNHPDLTTLSDQQVCQELTQAEQTISGITDQTTRPFFRPPYGARDVHVRTLAANLGWRTVYWTIDTIDWRDDATPESITEKVMNNLGNGVIVLMHAGSAVEAQTLDSLMTKIEQQGYQIVSLSQIVP